jgi:zinc protease
MAVPSVQGRASRSIRAMRRSPSLALLVCALAATSCSPGSGVTESTSARNDTTADPGSASSAPDEPTGPASTTAGSIPIDSLPDGERPPVALPGLLDPSDEPIANDDSVRTGTLDNGLVYYVRHNERPGGKAALRLVVKAGSVNETGAGTGVAHFVEHMLFNGTEEFPENELIDVLRSFGAAFGADINAYTAFDETVYELDVPSDTESLSTGMTVLEQWLSHATFDPAQVESERGIVLDEWRQSTQSVTGRLFEVAERLYLTGSPYEGRDPIGSDESISSVPVDELRQFYDDWYRPDNAAVVVVGDVDVDAVVADIAERFGPATPRTAAPPSRPDMRFAIENEPGFALHSDPDQATVDVEVDLPIPAIDGKGTAAMRAALLDSMIFDALVRRLDEDVTAGTAPFDEITTGTNSFVASLDAPALYAITDADRVDATLQALLDEYERADRYGFSQAETDLMKASAQAGFDSQFEGRATTQDIEYAEQYVANFLYGDPYPTLDELHATATAMIEAITPEALDLRFRSRWDNTAPHVIISTPAADEAAMPSEAEVLEVVTAVHERQVEPREGGRQLPDELMTAPEPVAPESDEKLISGGDAYFDPIELAFPNGARVVVTSNDIVDGQVGFLASSLGGSSLIDDADVVDGLYAADVVTTSGLASFNQTELESILADRDTTLGAWITPYTENFGGSAASADLEMLFQQLHLYMTQPRFDPIALTQLQRSYQPVVDDPSTDPESAGYDGLIDARYGDELRYARLPTPDQFATLDIEGVERVWRDRFGDAGDWVFAFAGDVDLDELRDLAGRYIGTLPGDATPEQYVDLGAAPPAGVVKSVVHAGSGDSSSLTLLFTSQLSDVDGLVRATTDVTSEVITSRLTDVIRERLGESYSPRATTYITSDPMPTVETYVQVTGAPERVESVGDLVVTELADLAANGPTEREFSNAFAQVDESHQFVDNQSFLQEMVDPYLWPQRDLDDYFGEYASLTEVDAAGVQQYIATHVPADRYIQVAVLPR